MHPLFSKVDETMSMTDFAKALDFDVFVETAPVDADYTDPKAHSVILPPWAMDCAVSLSHDDFAYAGSWENDEGLHALFVRPKTVLARSLWWVGVGFNLSQTPPKKQWGKRVAGEQHQGWFDDKETAKKEANKEALSEEASHYEIALFTMPSPSRFIDSDRLFEGMQDQARDEVGELADDWLDDIGPANTSDLNETVDLLIDGFVVDMNALPDFSINHLKAETFAAVPVQSFESNPLHISK